MLRALVVLCLIWAGLHSAFAEVTAHARRGPALTRRNDSEVFQGTPTPRVRLLDTREPQPAPLPDGPPLWSSTRTLSCCCPFAGATPRSALPALPRCRDDGDPRSS